MSNLVVIDGTVDSEVKHRTTAGGKPVADFRINDGKGWHTVVCWEDLADKIPPQGGYVVVSGRLQTRSYEAQDGGKRYVTEIVAASLTAVGAPAVGDTDDNGGDLF